MRANRDDPRPGDFDDGPARIARSHVQLVAPSDAPVVSLLVTIQAGDAVTLEHLAAARGKRPAEVIADLLRDAERSRTST